MISGIGGLGHLAVQYAKAMGLNVIGVDVDDSKLDLAKRLGASLGVNARKADPVAFIKKEVGGAQGVLVTAVSPKAFEQAIGMVARGGTVALEDCRRAISRSQSSTPCSTASRCAARSSAPASTTGGVSFAAEGKVRRHRHRTPREINKIFAGCTPAIFRAAS